jgi:hypothetical protein
MVENWNNAFSLSSGQFVGVFTDKMFLLPNILQKSMKVIEETKCDLISWADDAFVPDSYDDYFGRGAYLSNEKSNSKNEYLKINGLKELEFKSKAFRNRSNSNRYDYATGKICFGLYSRELCTEIVNVVGRLFLPISPDYTSMIPALLYSRNPILLESAGLIHINTDLSNGGKVSSSLSYADEFLKTFDEYEEIVERFLVHDSRSQHNIVLHDYFALNDILPEVFSISKRRWLRNILDDELLNKSSYRDNEIEEVNKVYSELFGRPTGFMLSRFEPVFIKARSVFFVSKRHFVWQLRTRFPKLSRYLSNLHFIPWKFRDSLAISKREVASIYDIIESREALI